MELGLGQWAYNLLDDFDFERLKWIKLLASESGVAANGSNMVDSHMSG